MWQTSVVPFIHVWHFIIILRWGILFVEIKLTFYDPIYKRTKMVWRISWENSKHQIFLIGSIITCHLSKLFWIRNKSHVFYFKNWEKNCVSYFYLSFCFVVVFFLKPAFLRQWYKIEIFLLFSIYNNFLSIYLTKNRNKN